MAFFEEICDSSSSDSGSLLQQMDSITQLIHTSFDSLIDILTKRKQQHLDQMDSIKSQYEFHLKSRVSSEESVCHAPQKDFQFFKILWRFDATFENLLSKLGQIDVLLDTSILPYRIFPENPVLKRKEMRKVMSDGMFREKKTFYSSIAHFRKCWYVLNETEMAILVLDDCGNEIKHIPIKIRDVSIKTRSLAVSEKYIFTWNKQENALLTFSHDGHLMPHIPQAVEFKFPTNLAAGKDDYLAISDSIKNHVVLLQPYLNDKHRAIGFASHDPANLMRPNDVCFAKDNSILVVDYNNPSVHMFSIKGTWICSFGSNQIGQELKSPKNVLITDQG